MVIVGDFPSFAARLTDYNELGMNVSSFQSPDKLLGELFRAVQLGRVFSDSKTFVDCVPKQSPAELVALYQADKDKEGFDLHAFVHEHFVVPEPVASNYVSDTSGTTLAHINELWDRLTRPADAPVSGSSRVPLPRPYVVPGGRFREIFYWDTYFTMLGLRESGRADLIRDMLDNFAHLIDLFGFIPNGNRSYFLSRSQPPYFALMVRLLADMTGPEVLATYLPQLRKEHDFWMDGCQTEPRALTLRVVPMPDGGWLNRYWDNTPAPRPEAYRQEVALLPDAEQLGIHTDRLYTHIRAACESGWDFSSRWFSHRNTLVTTRTADLIPVDLNCLLYDLETTLRDAYVQAGQPDEAHLFDQRATRRRDYIQAVFWNEHTGFYHDYDALANEPVSSETLAAAFPLFFKLATPQQAQRVHDRLRDHFLQAGGWVTTLDHSGQQWDWPNGWAPLQWIVYQGLLNYGFAETARTASERWLALNDKVFKATGKMMEKYNVVDASLTTGGGEYPNQDGFGWTNGVYLALKNEKISD